MTTYRLDLARFREHLLNAEWMVADMDRRAVAGYEFAREIAPDATPLEEGYVASFIIDSGRDGGVHHDRAYAFLGNYSPHAVFVEFGSENNAAHHVLTRALDVMGE